METYRGRKRNITLLCSKKICDLGHISMVSTEEEWPELPPVMISCFNTGKGLRRMLVCPRCERRVYEMLFFEDSRRLNEGITVIEAKCKRCSEGNPYAERTNINDQSRTDLIDHKISQMIDKLGLDMPYGEIIRDVSPVSGKRPDIKDVIPVVPYYAFDYRDYLDQRPKHAHMQPFKRQLVRLHLLYQLRNKAEAEGLHYTVTRIKQELSDDRVEALIREYEGV